MISLQKPQLITKLFFFKTILIALVILIIINSKSIKSISIFSSFVYFGILLLIIFTLFQLYFGTLSNQSNALNTNRYCNNNKDIGIKVYTNTTQTPQNEYDSLLGFNQIYHKFITDHPIFSNKRLRNGNNVMFNLDDKLPSFLSVDKIQKRIPELKNTIRDYLIYLIEEDEENYISLNKSLSFFNIQLTRLLSDDYYKKYFLFDNCMKDEGSYTVFFGDNKKLDLLINVLQTHCHSKTKDNAIPQSNIIKLLQYRIVLNERVMSDMFISLTNDLHNNLIILYSFKRLREIVTNGFDNAFYNNKGNSLLKIEWTNAFPSDTQMIMTVIVNSMKNKLKHKRIFLVFPNTPDYTSGHLYLYQKNPKDKEPYFCVFYKDTIIPCAINDNLFYSLQLYLEIARETQLFQSIELNVNSLLKHILNTQLKN